MKWVNIKDRWHNTWHAPRGLENRAVRPAWKSQIEASYTVRRAGLAGDVVNGKVCVWGQSLAWGLTLLRLAFLYFANSRFERAVHAVCLVPARSLGHVVETVVVRTLALVLCTDRIALETPFA